MSENDKTPEGKVLPHNYDGIQELNNPLPGWWLFTFYITIVFAFGYYMYYEIFDGPTSDEYLAESMNKIEVVRAADNEAAPKAEDLNLATLVSNKEMMAKGKAQFDSKCAACHGVKGEGIIGPNLTDNFWIHSKGDVAGILVAVQKGFLAKGMPPWENVIPKEEQPYLAAYVVTLKGTNPPNAKAPEGEEVQ